MNDARKRVHTLLTDRAVAGLGVELRAELDHLLVGAAIDPSYEAAAASIELALMAHAEPIPEAVALAAREQAASYWGLAAPRRHETTVGGDAQEAPSIPDLRFPDDDDDFLLGGDEVLGDEVLGDGAAVEDERWEQQHGPFESITDAIESGVLESSLTNGRIEREAKASESQRAKLPADLNRLRARASRYIDPEAESREDLPPLEKPERRTKRSPVVAMPVSESRVARFATYISAVLALIMLSIALWLYTHRRDPPAPGDVLAEVEAAEDTIEWRFAAKADPAVGEGAGGTVRWSSTLQTGVLTLNGLELNEATQSQYQLWIVDRTREGPSVDGGVFDVEAEGEVAVAIDAKLLVGEPSAFVITIERPGGVVVSEQSRVVMVATRAPP